MARGVRMSAVPPPALLCSLTQATAGAIAALYHKVFGGDDDDDE